MSDSFHIHHTCHINETESKVYEVLTSIQGLQNWWTPQTSGDPREGGKLVFEFGNRYRNVMAVETTIPNEKVVWLVNEGADAWIGTTIHFLIDKNEGMTRLRFWHKGYPVQDDFFAHCNFSWAKYLMSIRDLVETGKGHPYSLNRPMD